MHDLKHFNLLNDISIALFHIFFIELPCLNANFKQIIKSDN